MVAQCEPNETSTVALCEPREPITIASCEPEETSVIASCEPEGATAFASCDRIAHSGMWKWTNHQAAIGAAVEPSGLIINAGQTDRTDPRRFVVWTASWSHITRRWKNKQVATAISE